MTAIAQRSEAVPQHDVVHYADIAVTYRRIDGVDHFEYAATDCQGVEVDPHGDIWIDPLRAADQVARLRFTMSEESEASVIRGVRIGFSQADAENKPEVTDTGGATYEETYIMVSNDSFEEQVVTLTLTEICPEAQPIQPWDYVYIFAVVDPDGDVHCHDPKIYNKGEGGPPRPRR